MALVVKDRVKETTATTGTGTLQLSGAIAGFQSFTSALSNNDTTYYAIVESSTGAWEVGLGTFTSTAPGFLARTTILSSSNSGSAINLTQGDAEVFITQPAGKSVYLDSGGDLTVDNGTNTTLSIVSDDNGASTIALYGAAQGTGRVYVGQSLSYGGGIEYNGDNSPVTSGAGADYIALYRRSAGVDSWTARGYYSNDNWEFRGNLYANTNQRVFADDYHPNADTLTTPRTINGVSFNGSADITVADSTKLPLAGGTMTGSIAMGNNNITNVNNVSIGDPGPGEGIDWAGGNLWKIYESPNDLTTNSAGNLQVVQNATRRATFNTSGQIEVPVATGTAPFSISSTTRVSNLNVATAGTADTLTTARTIALSGAATGTATSFNGSANITIPVTALNATNLTAGTVPDARLTGTYSGITLQTNGGNTHYTTPNSGSASTNDRTVFGLAQYKSDGSAATGAIVFSAPNTNSTIMHRMRIEGMIYSGGPTVMAVVQGYRTTGAWSNTSKINLGITDIQVRWGVNPSGYNCLILGDVGTTWSYPMMAITHAMFSHAGVTDAYCKDWTVALVTDLSTYTNVTGTLSNTSITTNVTGNAGTATTLQNSRTINGVSFNGSANITITANTTNTLTRGSYLTGNNFDGSAATTWAVDATNANTASKVVARDASGNFSAGTITAALSGNATTATTLATPRTINGTSFDGSANITVTANTTNTLTRGSYLTGNNFDGSAATTWAVDATDLNTASKVVARDASGNFSAGTITATLSGNATTATTLQTARTINGVSFNGSANITVEPYIEDDESTNATRYVVFTDNSTGGYKRLNEDSALNYNPSTNTLTAGTISGNVSGGSISGAYIGVTNTSSSTGYGVSLYNGAVAGQPTYGLFFGGIATFGSFGQVTGDWATYFTMNNTANRGWIWRDISTPANVASLSNAGYFTAQRLYPGDGNDGYFFSDTNGRTAFAGGDFYIQSITNYYNYATNQYLGNTSGDNLYCRGNTISGNSWSITGAGDATFVSTKESYVALSGTTPSIDVDAGGGFSLTTSGNTTFTFASFTTAKSCAFVLELTAGGAHTITWPASVDWAGGTAPDAPASGATNIYVFWSRDGGTTWYGVLSSAAAA